MRVDFNRDVFYRNKLEFSYEVGWLPINIPFVFDVFVAVGCEYPMPNRHRCYDEDGC